jgi:hypothetical protein
MESLPTLAATFAIPLSSCKYLSFSEAAEEASAAVVSSPEEVQNPGSDDVLGSAPLSVSGRGNETFTLLAALGAALAVANSEPSSWKSSGRANASSFDRSPPNDVGNLSTVQAPSDGSAEPMRSIAGSFGKDAVAPLTSSGARILSNGGTF